MEKKMPKKVKELYDNIKINGHNILRAYHKRDRTWYNYPITWVDGKLSLPEWDPDYGKGVWYINSGPKGLDVLTFNTKTQRWEDI